MYTYLAYHGTTKSAAGKILETKTFRPSASEAGFLGTGAYFFEAGPRHALSWAERKCELEGGEAAVLEVTIKADVVINLCDRKHWEAVEIIHKKMLSEGVVPSQIGPLGLFSKPMRQTSDFGKNYCDHKVMNRLIETLNENIREAGQQVEVIRCPFVRGGPVYEHSWFFSGSCIMLSVVDNMCIQDMRVIT
ncbi:MAG: hypothetical protein AAFR75_01100 [Pseudomonadota bacterium]